MYRLIRLVVIPLILVSTAAGRGQNPGNNEDLCRSFRGKVLQITQKSLTIKLEGKVKTVEYRQVNGVEVTRTYLQDNKQPPRTFVFAPPLLYYSGLNPNYRGPGCLYLGGLVTDLRAGDSVYINYCRAQGQDYCTGIVIEARPGGKVPPVRGGLPLPPEKR